MNGRYSTVRLAVLFAIVLALVITWTGLFRSRPPRSTK